MKIAVIQNPKDRWSTKSMEIYGQELLISLEKNFKDLDINLFKFAIPPIFNLLPAKILFKFSRFKYYPAKLRGIKADVCHIVDHSFSNFIYSLDKERTVITCHDLIPLKEIGGKNTIQDKFALNNFLEIVKGLKEAAFVIADSQATKRDLVELLQIEPNKIEVVYLGKDETYKKIKNKKSLSLFKEKNKLSDKPLILHVGNNLAYKNIEGILKALQILKQKKFSFEFVKVGERFTKDQAEMISNYNLSEEINYLGQLNHKDLVYLYNAASVLIYPSYFEGFGLPVLESLACGLPTVISKNTSLEEIAGEAGVYVNPYNPESIAKGLDWVISLGDKEREKLSKKCLLVSKNFSWDRTARATYSVYKKVYG